MEAYNSLVRINQEEEQYLEDLKKKRKANG